MPVIHRASSTRARGEMDPGDKPRDDTCGCGECFGRMAEKAKNRHAKNFKQAAGVVERADHVAGGAVFCRPDCCGVGACGASFRFRGCAGCSRARLVKRVLLRSRGRRCQRPSRRSGLTPYVLESGTYGWLHAAVAGVLAFGASTIISPFGAGPMMPLLAFLAGLIAIGMRVMLIRGKILTP